MKKIEISKEVLIDLYINQNLSIKEVAQKLTVGKTTVNRYLKKYEIPIRDKKEAQKQSMAKMKKNNEIKNQDNLTECKNCGKLFYLRPSLKAKAKNHFCSYSCSAKYNNTIRYKNKLLIQCDYCGTMHHQNQYKIDNFEKHFCNKTCHSKWMSENNIGKNNSRYNRIITYCTNCNKELKLTKTQFERNKEFHFCSRKCMSEYYTGLIYGENHPSWKGGYKELYYGPNWKRVRNEVRKRDNCTCQRCGKTEDELGHALPVHHIKALRTFESWIEANVPENLVSLCPTCHGIVEQNGMDFEPNL